MPDSKTLPIISGHKMSRYPKAGSAQQFDSAFGGSYVSGFAWRGVLHSTETTSWPSYQGGAVAPHLTVHPRARQTRQHYSLARPSRALQHPPGTIDTNNARAVQIEIIAYSDNKIAGQVGGLRVDSLTADDLDYVASVMRWVESQVPIRRVAPKLWKPYPASAGVNNGVRFSDASWRTFNGWCGHQHVPSNDHGDPSDINIAALLQVAPTPVPNGEPMYTLAKAKGVLGTFASDGKNMFWLRSLAHQTAFQYQMKRFYGSADDTVYEYDADDLYTFMPGGFVGPVPPGWTLSADGLTLTPPKG